MLLLIDCLKHGGLYLKQEMSKEVFVYTCAGPALAMLEP